MSQSAYPSQTATGGATSDKQDTGNTALAAIQTAVEAVETQTADVATATNQGTTNTSLSNLEGLLADIDSTTTGSASSAPSTPIASTDVSGANMLALQVDGTFNLTLAFECSNDATTWFSCPMSRVTGPGQSLTGNVPGSNQEIYTAPVTFRYFRARVTAYSSGTVNLTLIALNRKATPSTQPVTGQVTTKGQNLTASSPTAATVGTSSSTVVAQNFSRKGLVLTNTSANTISLAFNATAVLNSGITLAPTGSPGSQFIMNEYTYTNQVVRAIAGGAGSNLAIQEFT